MENAMLDNKQETAETAPKSAKEQKASVRAAILKSIEGTEVTVARLKNKEDKAQDKKAALKRARLEIYSGFKSGEISLRSDMNDSKLKKYCSSLINNWLKKDKELA